MGARSVELVSGRVITGQWVGKDGKSEKYVNEKPYINHHEIQEPGIYLNVNGEIQFIDKSEILVIRYAYERENVTNS